MKSRSTKISFSMRFAFFEHKNVGIFFFRQDPDDRVEKEYISIYGDICTVIFVMGIFKEM